MNVCWMFGLAGIIHFIYSQTIVSRAFPSSSVDYNCKPHVDLTFHRLLSVNQL